MGRVLPIAPELEQVIACNICGGLEHGPVFGKSGRKLLRCAGCGLVFLRDPATAGGDARTAPALVSLDRPMPDLIESRRIVRQQIGMLRRAVGKDLGRKLLAIGGGSRVFLSEARRAGFDADSPTGDWREADFSDARFDVVTLLQGLEAARDPLGELTAIRRLLRPGGWLLLSAANIDGLLARLSFWLFPRHCPTFQLSDRRYLYSDRTLAELTERAGYEVAEIGHARTSFARGLGTHESWRGRCSQFAISVFFAPAALLGPWLGMGDRVCLSARRPD